MSSSCNALPCPGNSSVDAGAIERRHRQLVARIDAEPMVQRTGGAAVKLTLITDLRTQAVASLILDGLLQQAHRPAL